MLMDCNYTLSNSSYVEATACSVHIVMFSAGDSSALLHCDCVIVRGELPINKNHGELL